MSLFFHKNDGSIIEYDDINNGSIYVNPDLLSRHKTLYFILLVMIAIVMIWLFVRKESFKKIPENIKLYELETFTSKPVKNILIGNVYKVTIKNILVETISGEKITYFPELGTANQDVQDDYINIRTGIIEPIKTIQINAIGSPDSIKKISVKTIGKNNDINHLL